MQDKIVLGADSVIDLNGDLISKPESREEAMTILKNLTVNPLFNKFCMYFKKWFNDLELY